jgi:hypothetical protein
MRPRSLPLWCDHLARRIVINNYPASTVGRRIKFGLGATGMKNRDVFPKARSMARPRQTSMPGTEVRGHAVGLQERFSNFRGMVLGHGRKRLAGHAATVYPSRSVSTTSARSTPWDCDGSGGRDVALARGKVSRAAWPLNPEKGDANFMAAARLALARRPGVHG